MISCKLAMAPHRHPDTVQRMLTAFFVDPDREVVAYIVVRYDQERDRIAAFCRYGRCFKKARVEHNDYLRDLMLRLDAQAQLMGDNTEMWVDLPIEDMAR